MSASMQIEVEHLYDFRNYYFYTSACAENMLRERALVG